jgi:hypothetical protein
MNIFLNPHFSFSTYDKHKLVTFLKVHNIESNLNFFKLIHIFNRVFNKFYHNMDNEKLKIFIFDMILHFKFIYNPKNLQM